MLRYFTLSCIVLRLTKNIKYNSKKMAGFAFLLKDESQTYAYSSDKKINCNQRKVERKAVCREFSFI